MAPRNSMLAAGLAAGGYVATQAFVPSASGPVVNESVCVALQLHRLHHLRDLAALCL